MLWFECKPRKVEELSLMSLDCLPKPRLAGQQLKITSAWYSTQFCRKLLHFIGQYTALWADGIVDNLHSEARRWRRKHHFCRSELRTIWHLLCLFLVISRQDMHFLYGFFKWFLLYSPHSCHKDYFLPRIISYPERWVLNSKQKESVMTWDLCPNKKYLI